MRISDWSSDVCSSDLRPAITASHALRDVAWRRRCPISIISSRNAQMAPIASMRSVAIASGPRETTWGIGVSRSEEHTSELQSLMRISYAVFCLKKKQTDTTAQPRYNAIARRHPSTRQHTTDNERIHKHI